jgi:hypothetical protein
VQQSGKSDSQQAHKEMQSADRAKKRKLACVTNETPPTKNKASQKSVTKQQTRMYERKN